VPVTAGSRSLTLTLTLTLTLALALALALTLTLTLALTLTLTLTLALALTLGSAWQGCGEKLFGQCGDSHSAELLGVEASQCLRLGSPRCGGPKNVDPQSPMRQDMLDMRRWLGAQACRNPCLAQSPTRVALVECLSAEHRQTPEPTEQALLTSYQPHLGIRGTTTCRHDRR